MGGASWAGLRVWPTAKGIYYCSGQPLTVEGASSPLLYFCLLEFVYVTEFASRQVVEKTAGWPPHPTSAAPNSFPPQRATSGLTPKAR